MTACDRKAVPVSKIVARCAGIALAAAVTMLGLAADAGAQGAPTRLLPATPPPAAAPVAQEDAPAGRPGFFSVEELRAVSGDSFGVLDGDAGLGLDLWRGTRRSQLIELLSVMPGATRSHAMNALSRRLLLTTATMPPSEPDTASKPNLLALRASRLAALGDYEGLSRLIAAAPGRVEDESLLRQSVEGALLAGDNAGACRRARAQIGRFTDSFWQKTVIFCQMITGEQGQANLGASLMREQDPKGDATFHTLLAAMQGDRQAKIANLPAPAPLDVAMLNAAKVQIPSDAMDTRDAGMLAAMARNAATPVDTRLGLGERAEAVGTLSTSELAQIYGAMKFTPQQIANALSESDSLGGARGRALLYVAQSRQNNAAARAELLQRAYVAARAAGLYPTAVRLYAEPLKAIPATDDLGWFAGEAARASFAGNEPLQARTWLAAGLGFRPAAGAEGLAADVAALPYELLGSEKTIPWDNARWQRWKQAQGTSAKVKATILLALLEGLDRPAPDEAWDGLAVVDIDPAAHLPSPAVLRRLEVAAATERRGAAVLGALATFGPEGPAGTHPIVLGMAIAGLRQIGLQADARALALDAAVGAGL